MSVNTQYTLAQFLDGHLGEHHECTQDGCSIKSGSCLKSDFLSTRDPVGFLQKLNFGGLTCVVLESPDFFSNPYNGTAHFYCLARMDEASAFLGIQKFHTMNSNRRSYSLFLKVNGVDSHSYIIGIWISIIADQILIKELVRGEGDNKKAFIHTDFDHKFTQGLPLVIRQVKAKTVDHISSATGLPETVSNVAACFLFD